MFQDDVVNGHSMQDNLLSEMNEASLLALGGSSSNIVDVPVTTYEFNNKIVTGDTAVYPGTTLSSSALAVLKSMCGSPSLSELSMNTSYDESRASTVQGSASKKRVGLVLSELDLVKEDSRASPMSSNVTDNSSVDGEQLESEVSSKMDVSYSPVDQLRTSTEEANMLIELSESGRKSARSLSVCSPSQFVEPLVAASVSRAASPVLLPSEEANTMNHLLLLKSMPTNSSSLNSPIMTRRRSSTFAASSSYRHSAHSADSNKHTPMAALTWLASMKDEDLDLANSLFELKGHQFSLPPSAYKSSEEEEQEEEEGDEDPYERLYSHRAMDLMLPGEEYLSSSRLNLKNVAVPLSHNSNIVSRNANGSLSGSGRARSYSMTYLDKNSASSASHLVIRESGHVIRGSKNDPLSKALKRFNDKGAIGGEGYIGIYSPEDRRERIQRFLEKRKLRMWTKKVKYDVRKNFADSRVRVKGRFVKKEDEEVDH